ncbi:TPA: hypothetical protein QDB07_000847 [Burkholderia vietnamiensis]|uniref:hypothetical protein n=1 Tax=Burkholderia glumae TaxID=337 RepID=UPI0021502804|nr:hypothetical protein [Burkholderia glumae]HDR9033398.1 hypothetical protein [Burkholderia vietnamiensis]
MRRTTNSIIAFLAFLFGVSVFASILAAICHELPYGGIIYRLLRFFSEKHPTLGIVLLIPIGAYVLIYGLTAGMFTLFYGVAIWWWLIVAAVDLIGMLVRAPFSWRARYELRTLDFLKHPLLGSGPAPTSEMSSYAQDIARSKGITLSQETLDSYSRTRSFLNQHSGRKI